MLIKKKVLSQECFYLYILKAAAPTRSQSRGSAKESLTTREQDKRGRESRIKRRIASRVSPMTEVTAPTSADHHTSILDTKRKQRQEGNCAGGDTFV